MEPMRKFKCYDCGYLWEVPYGTGRQIVCPKCFSRNIKRINPMCQNNFWRCRYGK